MKNFIFTFILLFAVTFAYAQKQIDYVSFFPPAHVVHSEVTLTQNAGSFNYSDEFFVSGGTLDYTAVPGGLILGATKKSTTTVEAITVRVPGEQKAYAIVNFKVDNIIRVSSKGLIKEINLGVACGETTSPCSNVFISANNVSLPYYSMYPNNIEINVAVSENATITAPFAIISSANNFLPTLPSGHNKLKWVYLRIKGTEECRPYLVSYSGSTTMYDNYCTIPS